MIAAVAPVPVLAAGGITTGVDRQRAIALGAARVVIGTRRDASHEALDNRAAKARIVRSTATRRTTMFDLVPGPVWPAGFTGRPELDGARRHYRQAVTTDDTDVRVVGAGTGVSRIHELLTAGGIVRAMAGPGAAVPAARRLSGDPLRRPASNGGYGEDLPHG